MASTQAAGKANISPREYSAPAPGTLFPLVGGQVDNGTVWFRGLFSALGAALAACGRSGREISHLKTNHDLPFGECMPGCATIARRSVIASVIRRIHAATD